MLDGLQADPKGLFQSSPIESLIDAEVHLLERERDTQGARELLAREDGLTNAFSERYGQTLYDPAREKFKVEFLSKWAVNDVGVSGPAEFLNLLARLERPARERRPKLAIVDAIYSMVREMEAQKSLEEARRP